MQVPTYSIGLVLKVNFTSLELQWSIQHCWPALGLAEKAPSSVFSPSSQDCEQLLFREIQSPLNLTCSAHL